MDIKSTSLTPLPAPPQPAARAAGTSASAATAERASAPAAAAAAAPPAAVTRPAPERETLAQAVKEINAALKTRSPGLEFSVDDDTRRTVVKIVDRDTQEVIRQMPSEEALELAKALDLMTGLMEKQSV